MSAFLFNDGNEHAPCPYKDEKTSPEGSLPNLGQGTLR